MAVKSHNGRLGKFEYDDSQFSIADEKHGALIYIGNETKGENIKIPAGVVDLTNTFLNSDIESPPKIPYGVKNMTSTFMNTKITTMPDLPNTVENLDYAFAMTEIHTIEKMPKSVKSINNTFMGCEISSMSMHVEPRVRRIKNKFLYSSKEFAYGLFSHKRAMM